MSSLKKRTQERNTVQIATQIPIDQQKALREWCAKTDRSMSRYIRRAVQEQMVRDDIIEAVTVLSKNGNVTIQYKQRVLGTALPSLQGAV